MDRRTHRRHDAGPRHKLRRFLAPLDITTLRWSRQYTARAWAAALLTCADNNTLPATATEAVGVAEHDLHDTDASTWTTTTLHAAANLVRCNDSGRQKMAAAILNNHAARPCNETPVSCT